jgi:UbiD family decarboxylase
VITSTREFVEILKKENELLVIDDVIDPKLELAEIQRRVVAQKGPALLFTKVKGTDFPVASNLFGSKKRIEIAFGKRPEAFITQAAHTFETIFPPTTKKLWQAKGLINDVLSIGLKSVSDGPGLACQIPQADVTRLPQLISWPEDGGAFITLPLVYTEHPLTGKSNLGMYRIQMHDKNLCGMHIQIHRGGGFHYFEAEKLGQALPAHVYVGGPPALMIAAIAPLPEDVPEVLLASLLMGKKLNKVSRPALSPLPILADADFTVIGAIPPKVRKPEGPFGDHYGYYSLQHEYPVLNVAHVLHRKDAIYPLTVVGRPPQEDHFIACYLQDLLKPLISLVMPQVRQVWAFEESGVHSLAGAVVKDRYPREALTTALRILGEGQLSLSKILMVTDQNVDAKDFRALFTAVLERIDFARDLFVLSNISQDTLDYTGPKVNEGSKAIFLGIGEKRRELTAKFSGSFSDSRFTDARVFVPGALAVSGPAYQKDDGVAQALTRETALKDFPLVFLLDDAQAAVASSEDFIWHVFTRFEPAADIYAAAQTVNRFHIGLTPPVVIDCRLKPWYPKVLVSDPVTVKNIDPIAQKYRF